LPTLKALDSFVGFDTAQKQRTLIRTDSGFGGDYNVDNALESDWQVLTKGSGGRRPGSLARRIPVDQWQDLGNSRWIAATINPPAYLRPIQHWVLRWKTDKGRIKHSTILCSINEWSAAEIVDHYDDRGGCETEIRSDKSGLKLAKRRKLHVSAQETLILLTDVAHNLLAWTTPILFPEGPFAAFGPLRLIEDILAMPGELVFEQGKLLEVRLNRNHPYVAQVADGLNRCLEHFGWP
jgi:hypothetical protein